MRRVFVPNIVAHRALIKDLMVHVPKFYFENVDDESYRFISSETGNGVLFFQGIPSTEKEHKSVFFDMPSYAIIQHTFNLALVLNCKVVKPIEEFEGKKQMALLRSPDGWIFGLIHLGKDLKGDEL